ARFGARCISTGTATLAGFLSLGRWAMGWFDNDQPAIETHERHWRRSRLLFAAEMSEPLAAAESTESGAYSGLRIYVIGAYVYPDSFEWHVTDSLRHLGCSVELFHSRGGVKGWMGLGGRAFEKLSHTMLREPERLIEARLLRAIKDFSPTLILVLLGNQISPKTIAAIRRITHVPVVCWCQDQMTTLGRQ